MIILMIFMMMLMMVFMMMLMVTMMMLFEGRKQASGNQLTLRPHTLGI